MWDTLDPYGPEAAMEGGGRKREKSREEPAGLLGWLERPLGPKSIQKHAGRSRRISARLPGSIRIAVALSLLHVHAEFVLLVAPHVGIAHEVQGVVVGPGGWCHKVQFHLKTRRRLTNQGSQFCFAEGGQSPVSPPTISTRAICLPFTERDP